MEQPVDGFSPLYKYRGLSGPAREFVKRVFTHQELYFASRKGFNDPFDCRAKFSLEASKEDFKRYSERLLQNRAPHLSREKRRAAIRSASSNWRRTIAADEEKLLKGIGERMDAEVGIFCLSERPDHILMWSHYGESHTGICLEFSRIPPHSMFRDAQKVRYQEEYPVARILTDDDRTVHEASVLTKAEFWAYEQEWRILDHIRGPGVKRFSADLLTGVVLGARISDGDRAEVISWIQQSKSSPAIYQAEIHNSRYALTVVPWVG